MKIANCPKTDIGIMILALLLLFPSSASVLCIEPGGHIAIEDVNAACCASSRVHSATRTQSGEELNPAGNCGHCTDLFITPYGRGAVLESCSFVAGHWPALASSSNYIPPMAPILVQRGTCRIPTQTCASSSAPLRC